ncbi:thiopurine S-methyltransferase [Trypanosoma grayi]|uniref:thiopurine S-methyltransferase n=1 Tax=Trypanosoma grayi TaxID=71804 RepID=UPI0004F49B4A|nr:thiopurine S-methyltransferase [Trypanosoma grayi]KEG13718.1 thiopurine S-methyltransferase [Trypanosoma grayi]
MHLTSKNVAEFWNEVWSMNNTGWKFGERGAPFTRILYAYLQGAGVVATDDGSKADANEEVKYDAVRRFLTEKTVLVPLCGDSEVLPYMVGCGAAHVIGADLSEQALHTQRVVNFANFHFHSKRLERVDGATREVTVHEATDGGRRVTLFHGDITELPLFTAYTTLKVDFMYDRAAMMAVPPDLRPAYVRAVTKVLGANAGVAYERVVRLLPEEQNFGPPFMVDMEEVRRLYREATGRDYAAVLVLTFMVEGPRHPEWYALLPHA